MIALIGLGAVIIIGGQFINDIVGLVFEGGSYQTLRSSQSRAMQYISTIPLVLTSPLFGFGYARNYDLLLSVGNIDGHFLYLALQGGIVATLAMLLALARGIWIAGRAKSEAQSPQAKSIAWAIRITLVMMVALMLVYSMHNSHFYVALFLGAAIAIDRIRVSR
ncbi:MAG: hypothetical protein GWN81_16560 [Phycisphaerae bacterium]|nr:hypothetical protein [Phycisphaerae bacterium]NIU10424.1 hypothetical protein [Phycisphaerae bacterium]